MVSESFLGSQVRPSGDHVGTIWDQVGTKWEPIGTKRGPNGIKRDQVGTKWDQIGNKCEPNRTKWGPIGTKWGPNGTQWGPSGDQWWPSAGQMGASWDETGPKTKSKMLNFIGCNWFWRYQQQKYWLSQQSTLTVSFLIISIMLILYWFKMLLEVPEAKILSFHVFQQAFGGPRWDQIGTTWELNGT